MSSARPVPDLLDRPLPEPSLVDPALLDGPQLVPGLPPGRPFTRAQARSVGIERPALERMLRAGALRRLLRGVYVAAHVPTDRAVRAEAVRLALPRPGVVVDRTAAWVHGVDPVVLGAAAGSSGVPGPVPLDLAPDRGSGRRWLPHDLVEVDGLRLASPLRAALDLGRLLPPERGLAAMDALLRTGAFGHVALLAELPRFVGTPGVGRLRELAAQVDERAAGPAESVLRLHWNAAALPTALPGLVVALADRSLRLSLGVERRQFGAYVARPGAPVLGPAERDALDAAGWRVVVLPEHRVLRTDPELWVRHLEREFHLQLLAQSG